MPLYTTGAQALKASGRPRVDCIEGCEWVLVENRYELGELRGLLDSMGARCGFGKERDGVVRKRRRKEI